MFPHPRRGDWQRPVAPLFVSETRVSFEVKQYICLYRLGGEARGVGGAVDVLLRAFVGPYDCRNRLLKTFTGPHICVFFVVLPGAIDDGQGVAGRMEYFALVKFLGNYVAHSLPRGQVLSQLSYYARQEASQRAGYETRTTTTTKPTK